MGGDALCVCVSSLYVPPQRVSRCLRIFRDRGRGRCRRRRPRPRPRVTSFEHECQVTGHQS